MSAYTIYMCKSFIRAYHIFKKQILLSEIISEITQRYREGILEAQESWCTVLYSCFNVLKNVSRGSVRRAYAP